LPVILDLMGSPSSGVACRVGLSGTNSTHPMKPGGWSCSFLIASRWASPNASAVAW
jgi:hypothetical protein